MVDSASGIHPRHSRHYIRSVRGDNKDPVTQFLIAAGIPNEPDVMKPETTTVFFFPIESPHGSVTRDHLTAIDHLNLWKIYQESWCEHKPSITVNIREKEWPAVGGWVYDNFDVISGIAFLPYSDHVYQQAPYDECDQARFDALKQKMPKSIDWNLLKEFEKEDNTVGMQTMACSGDSCEIVDLVR